MAIQLAGSWSATWRNERWILQCRGSTRFGTPEARSLAPKSHWNSFPGSWSLTLFNHVQLMSVSRTPRHQKAQKKKARDAAASQSQRDASKVSSLSSLDVGTSPYQKKSLLNMFKPLQKQKPGRVVFSFNLQPLPTCWQCTCSSFFRIGPCSDRMYRINNLGLSSHQFWHLQHRQVKMVQHKPTNGPANCKTDLSVHMMDFRLVRDFASQLRLITD